MISYIMLCYVTIGAALRVQAMVCYMMLRYVIIGAALRVQAQPGRPCWHGVPFQEAIGARTRQRRLLTARAEAGAPVLLIVIVL